MRTRLRSAALLPGVLLSLIMIRCAESAVETQTMGNITFECDYGWKINGPDCYLLIDQPLTFEDAMETCDKYGASVVNIIDEVEAKHVGEMVMKHNPNWGPYWIGNTQTDADDVCGGFWDTGEPKDSTVSSPVYVTANARGRWQARAESSRFPAVCKLAACVSGTFRCKDGSKCLLNDWKCDGIYDCDDQSDESNCPSNNTWYYHQSSGRISMDGGYNVATTYKWYMEGPPGVPLSINFVTLDVENGVDRVYVYGGGPSFLKSWQLDTLTGNLNNRLVYGYNNFLIVSFSTDLSVQRTGFVADWGPDDELSHRERPVTATDAWVDLTSPYYSNDPSPLGYIRHYTVSTEEGSQITMEVMENEVGEGFELDSETLSNVNTVDVFPATYVSRSNTFSFHIVSNGCEGPEKFKARVKKGCSVDVTRANGFVLPPHFANNTFYPPSAMCTYVIRAPPGAQRAFQLTFTASELADEADSVKVFDGASSSDTLLTPAGGYTGANQAPSTPFVSTGPVVRVQFQTNMVQSSGFFRLEYNLACPTIADKDNMTVSSTDAHYGSEVTLSCNTGYSFVQQELVNETEISIGCGRGGMWNISRLPTCQIIHCGVPEPIPNGFIINGSGGARYNATVTYECYPGFSFAGSDTRTCGDGSTWSDEPVCQATQCSVLGDLENGAFTIVTGGSTDFGTVVNYTCNAGYDLVGSRYSVCGPGGNWSHTPPTCHRIKCPIPEVAMATLVPPNDPVEFESFLTVECPVGYVINGTNGISNQYSCLASGSFPVSRDVCVDEDECETVTHDCDLNGHEKCVNTKGSFMCECEDKYGRESSGAVCQVINRCDDGTSGCDSKNGKCVPTNGGEDYVCECDTGYVLFTEDGLNGNYVSSPETGLIAGDVYYLNHTCVPVICGTPPAMPNGRVLTEKTTFDFADQVEYRCDFGFRLNDTASPSRLTCMAAASSDSANGTWDYSAPQCVAITCDPLAATGRVANIYPDSATSPDDTVMLECFDDRTGELYNKTLYCAYNNQSGDFELQGHTPHCPAIDCGSLEPIGGEVFTLPSNTSLGNTFIFECQDGFQLDGMSTSGNTVVACENNGRWGLGNLTCDGERCVDPGTPGGMTQTTALFEVQGTVVYHCTRRGFTANPTTRTCVYNTTTNTTGWSGTQSVCEDVDDPVFTNCLEGQTIKLKLYQSASSKMDELEITDNSGLVTSTTVSPEWFRWDVPVASSQNVTYTASDAAGRTATCSVVIEVNDPGVLPSLTCPDYLTLDVNLTTPYNVSLADHVTADNDVTLTYSTGPIMTVGPETVGKTAVRVTAADRYGFERQCAFVVDIKPNACLSTYLEVGASAKNINVNCQSSADGVLNCTATCKNNYAYQDGTVTKTYDCQGANQWSDALPARSCVETQTPKYLFEVTVTYNTGGTSFSIGNCKSGLAAKLREEVPSRNIDSCIYFSGSATSVPFEVADTQYENIAFQSMTLRIFLAVNISIPGLTQDDLDVCGFRFNSEGFTADFFDATAVNCSGTTGFQNLIQASTTLVRHGKTCTTGYVLKSVGDTDMCVPCEPGHYYNDSMCVECPNGEYQDMAGQTQCKVCENGALNTAQPRLSTDQCVASCFSGFNNSQAHTDSPAQCMACAEDFYLATPYTASCVPCESGKTTSGVEGATGEGACIEMCGAGKYPVDNMNCEACPRGYFKSAAGNTACTACDDGETTDGTGSTARGQCVAVALPTCDNGGTAKVDYHEQFCLCAEGYYGDRCQNMTDACGSSPCYNNGTCSPTGPSSYTCSCPYDETCSMVYIEVEFSGEGLDLGEKNISLNACTQRCIDTAECAAIYFLDIGRCLVYSQYNNGSSSDSRQSFVKSCEQRNLFDGSRCENDLIDDCSPETCDDSSFCRDLINAADCVCPSDDKYRGDRCATDLDLCKNHTCRNGARCEDSGKGVRSTCVCQPGYTGADCEVDIDECEANPDGCLHGGSCSDLVNGYSCSCGQYSGDYCQNTPDFCSPSSSVCANGLCYNDYSISSAVCVCEFPYILGAGGQCEESNICEEERPCQNNSTLNRVSAGEYTCLCQDGYTGHLCQHDIDDCASQPCVHGKCTDLVSNYSCQPCDNGYEGKNCETNTDDCPGNCNPNNTVAVDGCEDLVGGYRCHCKVGFTGQDCETDINECQWSTCQHNGTCVESVTPGQYTCTCVDGWTGHNCESLLEFCNGGTCNNGGECYSLQDGPFCKCASGTFGAACQTTNDVCDIMQPCTPASDCQGADGTATCRCPANYTGSSCHLIEDGCSSSPCENGGTCVPGTLGYTCECDEGYSGETCSTEASACDSANCPIASECILVDDKPVCRCGAGQRSSGTICKDMSNKFDIYFTKRGNAIPAYQPFRITGNSLTLMFWVAPLEVTDDYPVQLRLSNSTTILAVGKDNVTFGSDDPVRLYDVDDNEKEFRLNHWNQFAVTWNGSHYDMYLNGVDLAGGDTIANVLELNEEVFLYIGADFHGYISQVTVWERTMNLGAEALSMYNDPFNPSNEDLLARWSDYRLSDNLWTRVIYPSIVDTSEQVCANGMAKEACDVDQPDKEPPTVLSCPAEINAEAPRLVQINDYIPPMMFGDAENIESNLERTVLTFGAHRLVYVARDERRNVALCRINAYVTRDGQSCSNTEGLDNVVDCAGKGRTVACPSDGMAPLSPKILTCGKLGSYNLDDQYQLRPAVVCGGAGTLKYTITETLVYMLGADCNGAAESLIETAIKEKVKNLNEEWTTVFPQSSCDNAQSAVKCAGPSNRRYVTATVTIIQVPATLTHRTRSVTLTAKELFQTATFELDTFNINAVFSAVLQTEDVVIVAKPSCDEGYGLHDAMCVHCTAGSFLNEATGMCELCAIGSVTESDGLTTCTECPPGKTTTQLGSKSCISICGVGEYLDLDLDPDECKPCVKNFYQNKTGQVQCIPCPAGKATESGGSSSPDLCFDTCDAGTELKNATCMPCLRGWYSDGIQQEACVQCPEGNTTAGEGSMSISQCFQTACPPGQSRNSTTNVCEECEYGFFQPERWQDECLQCNASYTTENKASTSSEQCMFVCPAGEENLGGGTTCTACETGFYRTDSQADRFMNCTACDSTFTTAARGSTSPDDCSIRICNAGEYRNETDNMCYPCPVGQYQPNSLQTECLPCFGNLSTRQQGSLNSTQCVFYCAEGYETALPAGSQKCTACVRGQFKTNVGDAKFDSCQPCPSNTTNNVASMSAADCDIPACTAGQTISEAGVCVDCANDFFQDEALPDRATDCQSCPTGKGTREDKQTSEGDCEWVCGPGEHYDSNSGSCVACPMGTWNTGNETQRFDQCAACPGGFVTVGEMTGASSVDNCTLRDCPAGEFINDSDACVRCPVGKYQDVPRQRECKPCRNNTNTNGDGKKEEADCTISCTAGQEQVPGDQDNCQSCQKDFYKEVEGPGKCDQCAGNFTANDNKTACDVLFCDSGFELIGSECVPCDMGKYKVLRGDNYTCESCPTNTTTASVASTSLSDCTRANCDIGFYSLDNDTLPCLPCPVGMYKDYVGNGACRNCENSTTAGVASTASDQCSVVVCPIGQFRTGQNQCQNCSMGSFQNETGQEECYSCPGGYTTVVQGASSADDCKIVCPIGSFRDASNTCADCPVGEYQDSTGETACVECPTNYTTSAARSNSSTDCFIICSAGEFSTSRTTCGPCDNGAYQPSTGADACIRCGNGSTTLRTGATAEQECQPICERGQYLDESSRTCVNCSLGYYNPAAGTDTAAVAQCLPCPDGNTTAVTGAVSVSDCNILDCKPGTYRSPNVGCQPCPKGQYQPAKSQTSCIPCDGNLTTYTNGRTNSASCIINCPDGNEYNIVDDQCDPCGLGYHRKADTSQACIKCPPAFTTLKPGEKDCVPRAAGVEPPVVQTRTIRIRISLRIGACDNRAQIGNIIIQFITSVLLRLDLSFPTVCRNRCDNLAMTFQAGCLQGFTRGKRAAHNRQDVELSLAAVDQEVENTLTNDIRNSMTVVRDAFNDISNEEPTLLQNQIEFAGVESASATAECQPGQFTNGSDCYPCAAGTYSVDGLLTDCTPCAADTYQNDTGKSSCMSCPGKTYTGTTGSMAASDCLRRCDERDARKTYCNDRGACVFDITTSDGVRCDCDNNYSGNTCGVREAVTDDKDLMIGGIVGGACAFLLLVLLIFGIVACLRHSAKKGKNGHGNGAKDDRHLYRGEDGLSEAYPDYNYPMYDNGMRGYAGKPAIMYMNPAADQDVRDFYTMDRSTATHSRQRSRSYEGEWRDTQEM